jgi:hypothetical protein
MTSNNQIERNWEVSDKAKATGGNHLKYYSWGLYGQQ